MAGDVPRRPDAAAPFQSTLASTVRVVLATATDGELCNVVGALDGLSSRAGADALLTELRPRIGGLRPSRPLRFSRLLALPLEPVLVPSTAWGSDRSGIPRAALRPVIEAVRSALGGEATRIESAARGCTMADTALVALLRPLSLAPRSGGAAAPAIGMLDRGRVAARCGGGRAAAVPHALARRRRSVGRLTLGRLAAGAPPMG